VGTSLPSRAASACLGSNLVPAARSSSSRVFPLRLNGSNPQLCAMLGMSLLMGGARHVCAARTAGFAVPHPAGSVIPMPESVSLLGFLAICAGYLAPPAHAIGCGSPCLAILGSRGGRPFGVFLDTLLQKKHRRTAFPRPRLLRDLGLNI